LDTARILDTAARYISHTYLLIFESNEKNYRYVSDTEEILVFANKKKGYWRDTGNPFGAIPKSIVSPSVLSLKAEYSFKA
jgi:hypothetical protein